ncbi:MAG: ATP-binding protein [Gammaproteobacteria bacterium]
MLLGARQTGKTTLIHHEIKPDISYTFIDPEVRIRYEKEPSLLAKELKLELIKWQNPPLIFMDEIQKIPGIMDVAQLMIDQKKAQFILSGSSVRKLKYGASLNLLPGRVVSLTMDPLHIEELPTPLPSIEEILIYGTLPSIITEKVPENKNIDLRSYVTTYLEEEIRLEALVRNIGHFSRFLELAASESGKIVNFTKLSQDVGVAVSTIIEYYQILEDCMIALRIDPIIHSSSHRRLIKSPKYLFFDLGIRRACTNEGTSLPENYLAILFEQYIGIELIHQTHHYQDAQVKYWRDSSGVEIDYVLSIQGNYIPIEVKWTEKPLTKDTRHLQKFLAEYHNTNRAYVICRTPHAFEITDNVIALPWQQIREIFQSK